MTTADGIAIGGGAVTASLLDFLVEKGVIGRTEAFEIVNRALARLVILDAADRAAASAFITSLSQQIAARD
jgi:hypothetical protein